MCDICSRLVHNDLKIIHTLWVHVCCKSHTNCMELYFSPLFRFTSILTGAILDVGADVRFKVVAFILLTTLTISY